MSLAVITGAASGMGRACVERLRKEDVEVVAVDLKPPDVRGAVPMVCDISDSDSVQRLVEHVAQRGGFRSLVHAAGISPTMADSRRVFEGRPSDNARRSGR